MPDVYYMIRHRPTGMHIPCPDGRSGRGGTWVELSRFPFPPRLFNTGGAAACALTWWLKGQVDAASETEDDWAGNPYTIKTGAGEAEHVADRRREDMEVVSVRVEEVALV